MQEPPVKYWKMVHVQAWRETKERAREHIELTMLGIIAAALVIVGLWSFGRTDGSVDELVGKLIATGFLIASTFWLYWKKIAEIPARWHNEKVQIIQGLRAAQEAPPMLLRELALHLHGRVKRFSAIEDLDKRFDAVKMATLDALGSSTALPAMGRRVDWMTQGFANEHSGLVDIPKSYWSDKRSFIEWWSVGKDDPFSRALVRTRGDAADYYDLCFDRASVLRRWPADNNKEISVLKLAELAEVCLGYDFTTRRGHAPSFISGMREAASLGDLEMLGRFGCYDKKPDSSDAHPLRKIGHKHFEEWWISAPKFQSMDNWAVHTYRPADGSSGWIPNCYRDLHCVDRGQALAWLLAFEPKRQEPKNEPERSDEAQ